VSLCVLLLAVPTIAVLKLAVRPEGETVPPIGARWRGHVTNIQ
jgi:hypothetical protein